MDAQPFCYVNQVVDPGLIAPLRTELVPSLEAQAPVSEAHRPGMAANARPPRSTLVSDREGYSPAFFSELEQQGIAVVTYHKFPGPDWPVAEFAARPVELAGGQTVTLWLAERATELANGLAVREVGKLTESGRQVPVLSANRGAEPGAAGGGDVCAVDAGKPLPMREHFGLDRLIEYGTTPVPANVSVVNPARRELDATIGREADSFIDTIKMIAYRAETSMAGSAARPSPATVRLHHLAQNIHDEAVRHLCADLTATETVFPGTELRLIYQPDSS